MTVSIVIPTFNRAALLPRAIESALAQGDRDVEVIVVDDGSTDDTPAVLRGFTDRRVRSVAQANAGVSAARNAGAGMAVGDRLLFLDSDDELVPEAVQRFREAADEHGWRVVISGWTRVSADGRERVACIPERNGAAPQLVGPYLPGAFLLDRALFAAIGGYDEHLRFSENTVLAWRVRAELARGGAGIGMIPDPLVVRYSQPDRAFDRARYDAAVRILEHYTDLLDDPATGGPSARHRRATYEGIAGASAAALGLRRDAWRHAFAALRREPGSPARYRTLLGVALATMRRSGDQPAQKS